MEATGGVDPVEKLKAQLEEKDLLLHRAGQYGTELMEHNKELTESLEECNAKFTKKLEVLKEENYSLHQRVDQKMRMEMEYQEEIETLKKHLSSQREEMKVLAELKDQSVHLSQLKQRLRDLEASNETSEMEKKHLKCTLAAQEEQIANLNEKLHTQQDTMNETASDEVASLSREVSQLESIRDSLKHNLQDAQNENSQVQQQLEQHQNHLGSLQAELQEVNSQMVALSNSFMSTSQENQELRCEIDVLRLNNETHKKKGNSMFSELDDKRQEAEKRLLALSVQHDTLKNQHDLSKKHLQKLKLQMSMVLQMSSGQVDSGHVHELENQLAQARCELQTANTKLSQFSQEKEADISTIARLKANPESSSEARTLQYVEAVLKTKEAELASANEELQQRRLRSSYESRALAEAQQKLRTAESRTSNLQAQNIQLTVKLEEMKNKCPVIDNVQGTAELRKGRKEQIPGFNEELAASVKHHLIASSTQSLDSVQESDNSTTASIHEHSSEPRDDDSEKHTDLTSESSGPLTPNQDQQIEPLTVNSSIHNTTPSTISPHSESSDQKHLLNGNKTKPAHWLTNYDFSYEESSHGVDKENAKFCDKPSASTKSEPKVIKVKSEADNEEVNNCNTQ